MRYLLIALAMLSAKLQSEEIVYKSEREKKVTHSTWKIDKKKPIIAIVGTDGKETTKIECTSNKGFLSYTEFKDDEETLKISRENDRLIAEKQEHRKEYHIGNTPWIQDFAFGLWSFLESADTSYKFCIVNPYKLDMHKMVATKHEVKTVTVNGTEYDIRIVNVTLQGFQKNMWKAELWYNVKSNDLIRYKANEGPFTPITITSLVSKKT